MVLGLNTAMQCSLSLSFTIQTPPEQQSITPSPLLFFFHNPMSFWTCAKCTFINEGRGDGCKICLHRRSISSPDAKPAAGAAGNLKWGCRACTFLNKKADSACDMCGTPKSDVSLNAFAELDSALDEANLGAKKFWPLRSCTSPSTEVQDGNSRGQVEMDVSDSPSTSNVTVSLSSQTPKRKADDSGGGSGGSSNNILGQLHLEKIRRMKQPESGSVEGSPIEGNVSRNFSSLGNSKESIVILTYNVWFREDLEVLARMRAIEDIIQMHKPHFICFQEVTPNIFQIFQESAWWREYNCSVSPAQALKRRYYCIQLSKIPVVAFHRKPFLNSVMGRELCLTKVDLDKANLIIATTHLESPCPAPPTWDQMFSSERVSQAKVALTSLKDVPNVVFGGDMNWDDKLDGSPPLPAGWCDAWLKLNPGQDGFTYDCKANTMLTGRHLQKRLDRIFCHMQDFRLQSIEMVGTWPIPGISYKKEIRVRKHLQNLTLPVLPSDHFGLLLKICPEF